MKFTADFTLNLRWYEPRLNFYDLNNVTSLNSLSKKDLDRIWTPHIYVSALGGAHTQSYLSTSGVVIREHNPLPEDMSLPKEGILF